MAKNEQLPNMNQEQPENEQPLDFDYQYLGDKIKKAREEAGLSQKSLATMIGLTPSAVANYELAIRQIPVHLLLRIANLVNRPMSYFLGPEAEPAIPIKQALLETVGKLSETVYVDVVYELKDGKLLPHEGPDSYIPVPPSIAEPNSFALIMVNPETSLIKYVIIRHFSGKKPKKSFIFTKMVAFIPEPDAWIIATKGDTTEFELTQFKDVTPADWEGSEDEKKAINVQFIVTAIFERTVK